MIENANEKEMILRGDANERSSTLMKGISFPQQSHSVCQIPLRGRSSWETNELPPNQGLGELWWYNRKHNHKSYKEQSIKHRTPQKTGGRAFKHTFIHFHTYEGHKWTAAVCKSHLVIGVGSGWGRYNSRLFLLVPSLCLKYLNRKSWFNTSVVNTYVESVVEWIGCGLLPEVLRSRE